MSSIGKWRSPFFDGDDGGLLSCTIADSPMMFETVDDLRIPGIRVSDETRGSVGVSFALGTIVLLLLVVVVSFV